MFSVLNDYTWRISRWWSGIFTSATEGEGDYVFTPLCLFVCCKIEDFSSILIRRFFFLSVCLSPTGHNSKPIVMKRYQVVEVVSTEKPIDFEVKGQRSSSGQISKIIFHPIDLKFEQDLHLASLSWETNYIWGQKVKGQHKVKLLKSSISIWKISNFHLIDLSFD